MQRRLLAATAIVWAIAGTACGAPGTTGSADSRIGPIDAPSASAVPANPGQAHGGRCHGAHGRGAAAGTLIGGAEATSAALARAEATPGFTALDAYQSGRLVVVDGSAWASAGGPIAAGVIVDDVAAALLATDT